MPTSTRPRLAAAAALVAVAALAVPVLGSVVPAQRPVAVAPGADEDPDATPAPGASEKPGKGPKAVPPGQVDKANRPPEHAVELTGRVGTRGGEDGATEYTLTVGGTVLELEVGPPWFWGDDHPLAAYVGKTVTVEGEQAEGSDSVDVRAVDGTVIREAGRPPWAGGPAVVGETHPGWKAWKVERAPGTTGRPPWAGPKDREGDETP